jgi:hypothetical protein
LRRNSPEWLCDFALVDELGALEPPFAPVRSPRFPAVRLRDTLIDAVRASFPRSDDRSAGNASAQVTAATTALHRSPEPKFTAQPCTRRGKSPHWTSS